mmetsp:Transcript_106172/g.226627  ORF Transcript_106172/g.226627 Transcript_106172/m.226627 type:complete len:202 (-) Transcript_106172:760-1365(-)
MEGRGLNITTSTSVSSRIFGQSCSLGTSAAALRMRRISVCGRRPGHSADTSKSANNAFRLPQAPKSSFSISLVDPLVWIRASAAGPHPGSKAHRHNTVLHPPAVFCGESKAGNNGASAGARLNKRDGNNLIFKSCAAAFAFIQDGPMAWRALRMLAVASSGRPLHATTMSKALEVVPLLWQAPIASTTWSGKTAPFGDNIL